MILASVKKKIKFVESHIGERPLYGQISFFPQSANLLSVHIRTSNVRNKFEYYVLALRVA